MKKIKGAKPPKMAIIPVSDNSINLKYISKRELNDYFLGLLMGSSKFFNEKIEVNEVDRKPGELTVHIKFENSIAKSKKFLISNGYLVDNKPTSKGADAIVAHFDVIEAHKK